MLGMVLKQIITYIFLYLVSHSSILMFLYSNSGIFPFLYPEYGKASLVPLACRSEVSGFQLYGIWQLCEPGLSITQRIS